MEDVDAAGNTKVKCVVVQNSEEYSLVHGNDLKNDPLQTIILSLEKRLNALKLKYEEDKMAVKKLAEEQIKAIQETRDKNLAIIDQQCQMAIQSHTDKILRCNEEENTTSQSTTNPNQTSQKWISSWF